jgi:RAD50-interacting protein 1
LGIEKLCMDIEEIAEDEILYAHMLDEVLSFEHELKESYGYPSNMPSVISVVTQPQFLVKWLSIEERCEWISLVLLKFKDFRNFFLS